MTGKIKTNSAFSAFSARRMNATQKAATHGVFSVKKNGENYAKTDLVFRSASLAEECAERLRSLNPGRAYRVVTLPRAGALVDTEEIETMTTFTRENVRRWMLRNLDDSRLPNGDVDYTHLAEQAACAFNQGRVGGPLDQETHWIWDLPVEIDC